MRQLTGYRVPADELYRLGIVEAVGEGVLDRREARYIDKIIDFGHKTLEDVMTPRMVMAMLPASTSIAEFLDHESSRIFSRIHWTSFLL